MLELIYSLLFAATVLSALMVVFSRHPVHSALYLVAVMVAIAAIFVLINAQLAAVLQVLVYAGAIMVLFLFVIMLLNLGPAGDLPLATRPIRRIGWVFFVLFLIQGSILALRFGPKMTDVAAPPRMISISDIAMALLTKYLFAFEMTSVMLLVAIVGAIVLARRRLDRGTEWTQEGEG